MTVTATTNKFYDKLYEKLNNRDTIPTMTNVSVETQKNNKTSYNASGNIRVKASIPQNSAVPNYCEDLINSGSNVGSLKLLLSFITDKNFVTTVEPVTKTVDSTVTENGIKVVSVSPNIDLAAELKKSVVDNKPWHMWNLNYNRNLDDNEIKKIAALFVGRMNEMIDYVITNDITTPDENFRTYVKKLFMDSTGKNLYSFAHFTLVLPALVNYLANKNGKFNEHAMRYAGYVKAGSKLLPKTVTSFADEVKWHKKGETKTAMEECPYLFIRDGEQQATIGQYNYPLSSAMKSKWTPTTIKINENVDLDLLKNIKVPTITSDIFNDSNTIKQAVYMQTETGPTEEPSTVVSGRKLTSSEFAKASVIALPTCAQVNAHGNEYCGTYKC